MGNDIKVRCKKPRGISLRKVISYQKVYQSDKYNIRYDVFDNKVTIMTTSARIPQHDITRCPK